MVEMKTTCFEDLVVGMSAELTHPVNAADIEGFAHISGDSNPVHLDEEYARATPFKGIIAHGMLSAAFISTLFGTRLPGPGTIYLSQTLNFKAPVRPGDEVLARVTVAELMEKRRVRFDCECRVGDTVVLAGEAIVMAPGR